MKLCKMAAGYCFFAGPGGRSRDPPKV